MTETGPGAEQLVILPPSFPAIRTIDLGTGEVLELVPPETAQQQAVEWRSKARKVADAIRRYAGWLDDEAIRLILGENATAVVDAEGRTWYVGKENLYGPVNAGVLHDELLLYANDPKSVGGPALVEKINAAFRWVNPLKPEPYWTTDNAKLSSLENIVGLGPIIQKHRSKTEGSALRERK